MGRHVLRSTDRASSCTTPFLLRRALPPTTCGSVTLVVSDQFGPDVGGDHADLDALTLAAYLAVLRRAIRRYSVAVGPGVSAFEPL